jgi:phosphotriesterase-related protein
MKIVDGGAYIGFDRFGLEIVQPDSVRVESLLKLLKKGAGAQVVISHDSVWCWRGHMLPPAVLQMLEGGQMSMRFTRVITPMLKEAGIADAQIDSMLTDNPRRYFSGEVIPKHTH